MKLFNTHILCLGLLCFAMSTNGQVSDSLAPETPKQSGKMDHYIGLQANTLLKQIISLDNSSSVNNPYFLKYLLEPTGFLHLTQKNL